ADYTGYRWNCTIALRMAGRFNDAISLIRDGKIPGSAIRGSKQDDNIHSALLDWESGKPLEARTKFAALGYYFGDSAKAEWRIRASTWRMTLAASAAIDGGDTLTAKSLVDSIEAIGKRS